MSTTLPATITPTVHQAAEVLVNLARQGNTEGPAEAEVVALAEQLADGGPVETDADTLAYTLRDALVMAADQLDPMAEDLEKVEADAQVIATLAAELRKVETGEEVA